VWHCGVTGPSNLTLHRSKTRKKFLRGRGFYFDASLHSRWARWSRAFTDAKGPWVPYEGLTQHPKPEGLSARLTPSQETAGEAAMKGCAQCQIWD